MIRTSQAAKRERPAEHFERVIGFMVRYEVLTGFQCAQTAREGAYRPPVFRRTLEIVVEAMFAGRMMLVNQRVLREPAQKGSAQGVEPRKPPQGNRTEADFPHRPEHAS